MDAEDVVTSVDGWLELLISEMCSSGDWEGIGGRESQLD